MNFPDFIEKIVLKKEYNQLTPGEQSELAEWIRNEEEYNSVKFLLIKMNIAGVGEDRVMPSIQTKEKLTAAFAARHPKPTPLSAKRRVWILSAAASVIVILAAVFLLTNKNPVQQPFTEIRKETPVVQPDIKAPVQDAQKTEENQTLPSNKNKVPESQLPVSPDKKETPVASVALADQPDLEGLTVVVF